MKSCAFLAAMIVLLAGAAGSVFAQSETDLAKATQNPIADLTSIPVQFNFYSGGDLGTQTQTVTNLQPVMPLPINDKWNVIARTVIPFVSVPLPGGERSYGIADIQEQLFLTPTKTGGLVWGVGAVASLPTATNAAVSTGQTALGPAGVALKTTGPWVVGALANNIWRVMGEDPSGGGINQFFLQPFINFNFKRGWALSAAPAITADWNAPSGEQWTVPVGMGISKVTRIGNRPVSVLLQYYHLAERPPGTPDTNWRMQINFLFPNPKPKEHAAG